MLMNLINVCQGRNNEESSERKQAAVSSTARVQQATAGGTRTRTDQSELQPSGATLELDAAANCMYLKIYT